MLVLLTHVALAGSVYVNGVDVGDMRSQTFENATVVFDSSGNIHISAPGYQIQVVGEPPPPPAGPALGSAQSPVTAGTAPTPSPSPAPPPAGVGIGAGQWWLVTEDSGSAGHTVEVLINGTLVQSVRSGQPQLIFDLGPYLVYGTNTVTMRSNSVSPTGGTLYLYVGTGRNEAGTVMMDTPKIQFGLGTSRNGPYTREYTIEVPRP